MNDLYNSVEIHKTKYEAEHETKCKTRIQGAERMDTVLFPDQLKEHANWSYYQIPASIRAHFLHLNLCNTYLSKK